MQPFIRRLIAGALTAALYSMVFPPILSARQQADDEQLVCQFEAAVSQFVRLHREIEKRVPPRITPTDAVHLFTWRLALAAEIRAERPLAKQGDIFTPEIAAMFRRIVMRTLSADRIDWAVFLQEDGMYLPLDVVVNGDYPAFGPVATMSPTLLRALPSLPAELQYRFVNGALILWDVPAGLIVDFVPEVFRRTTDPETGATAVPARRDGAAGPRRD